MTIKIEGLNEVKKALRKLPINVQKRVVRSATRSGANIIKKEAIKNVPVREGSKVKKVSTSKQKGYRYPGYLKQHIALIKNRRIPRNVSSYLIKLVKMAYYGAFLEFGTAHQSAKPWMRPAYESKKTAAVIKIKDQMLKGIDREQKKIKK